MDPPHSVCNSEKEQFFLSQKKFLQADPALKKAFKKAKSSNKRQYERCDESKNSGGCLEYFLNIKKFMSDFEVISNECRAEAYADSKIKKVFKQSLSLMVNLAWGTLPPETISQKFSWFDQADISLFCKIKKLSKLSLTKASWNSVQEKILQDLPGAESLSRDVLWKSSLLSTSCTNY